MNTHNSTKWIHTLGIIGLAKLSSFLKLSFVFGSFFTWFSASSIAIPLIGSFGGTFAALLFFIISLLGRFILGYGFSLKILAFYIPGLCASLYLAKRSDWLALCVPLISIAAFITHPVGGSVYLYSAYWLIPIFLFFIPEQTMFSRALTATFIAHAVGSTIWIYTQPTTEQFWLALIPLVACERLIYALGMVTVQKAITAIPEYKKTESKIHSLHSV